MKRISETEIRQCPVNNPKDPYGHPLIVHIVCARDETTGRWWYVKQYRSGVFTWTRDQLYARHYSAARARYVQSRLPAEF